MPITSVENSEREHTNEPYFILGSPKDTLRIPGVFAVVSVLHKSPLLETHGARQLLAYLRSLPHPSIILVADSLSRHNNMALQKNFVKIDAEKARRAALELGNSYVMAILNAMEENKNHAGIEKITLIRWDDVTDENYVRQQAIAHNHYNNNILFRERIDKLAMEYLNHRRPRSKYTSARLPYLVQYLLEELPSCVTGLCYEGKRYQTLVYATTPTYVKQLRTNGLSNTFWGLWKDIRQDPAFADLKEKLLHGGKCLDMLTEVIVLPVLHNPDKRGERVIF